MPDNRHLDWLAKVVGATLLVAAIVVATRPTGPVKYYGLSAIQAAQRWYFVRQYWDSLSNSASVIGMGRSRKGLIEFVDYQCVYCRAFHDTTKMLLRAHPDIAIVIRHSPHPALPASRLAALAAICGTELGVFQKIHAFLLRDTVWPLDQNWHRVATEAGITDLGAFDRCRESSEAHTILAEDLVWAEKLALRGTPVLITEQRGVHLGLVTVSEMTEWLDLPRSSQ